MKSGLKSKFDKSRKWLESNSPTINHITCGPMLFQVALFAVPATRNCPSLLDTSAPPLPPQSPTTERRHSLSLDLHRIAGHLDRASIANSSTLRQVSESICNRNQATRSASVLDQRKSAILGFASMASSLGSNRRHPSTVHRPSLYAIGQH